jgi:hypothetical protein
MSNEADKFNHSKRLLKDENAIKKQTKIAKSNGAGQKVLDQPHRLAKHHAMDCGNPGCILCGNPRRTWNELTIQEKRKFQEMEIAQGRRSNGMLSEDQDESKD